VHRQQLDGGHPQPLEVVDHRRAAQCRVGAAQRGRHVGVGHGEAAHVHLTDHHVLPRDHGAAVVTPGEGRFEHAALGHERRAVAAVERKVLALAADRVAVERVAPAQLAHQVLRIGVEHQLVGVEAVALLRLVGAVHPVAVGLAGARLGQVAVPHAIGAVAQRNALQLLAAAIVEKAQLDLLGVLREESEVDALPVPGGAARVRPPGPDGGDGGGSGVPGCHPMAVG